MAPLAGLRFTHKAKGVTMHDVGGVTGVKEREKGVFSSLPLTAHAGVSPNPPPPNTPSPPKLPTTKHVSKPPAPVQTPTTTVSRTVKAPVAPPTQAVIGQGNKAVSKLVHGPNPTSTSGPPNSNSKPGGVDNGELGGRPPIFGSQHPTETPKPPGGHPGPGNPPDKPSSKTDHPNPTSTPAPGGGVIKSGLFSIFSHPRPTGDPNPQDGSPGKPPQEPPSKSSPPTDGAGGGSSQDPPTPKPSPPPPNPPSHDDPPLTNSPSSNLSLPKPSPPPSPTPSSPSPNPPPPNTPSPPRLPTTKHVSEPLAPVQTSTTTVSRTVKAPVAPPTQAVIGQGKKAASKLVHGPNSTSTSGPPNSNSKPGGVDNGGLGGRPPIFGFQHPTETPKPPGGHPGPGNPPDKPPSKTDHPNLTRTLAPGGDVIKSVLFSIFSHPRPTEGSNPPDGSPGKPPQEPPSKSSPPTDGTGGGHSQDPPPPENKPSPPPPNPPSSPPPPNSPSSNRPLPKNPPLPSPTPDSLSPYPPPSSAPPPPGPPAAKQVSDSHAPVQTQATAVSCPVIAPVAPTTTQAPSVPTLTATNTAVGDQESDPSLTAPPARIQSGNVVGNKGKETTIEVQTTFVTTGVFTTSLTTVLPDGQTTVVVATSTGIHTVTTSTAVPTQIGTISSKSGPPAGTIGGVIGATVIVILALIAFCILRHKRRNLNRRRQVAPNARPPIPIIGPISAKSTVPRPFLGTSSPHEQPPGKRAKEQLESPNPEPRRNRENGQDNTDPFRDPETVQGQDEQVVGAKNALDRLQELTREAEEELRELGNRARRGELSDSEQARLDEIRRTTGLTIVYDPGLGRLSATSSDSSFTTSPPSYHSDRG